MYESQGGRVTRDSSFGYDPLCNDEINYSRRQRLFEGFRLTGKILFSAVVHGHYEPVRFALERYYELTIALSRN